ncbi:hypothetical protein IL306_009190 [Fusarium sp. DS 682]|nr:hypothetical protein IL306_009190 [Fusarium sp. DS 682]
MAKGKGKARSPDSTSTKKHRASNGQVAFQAPTTFASKKDISEMHPESMTMADFSRINPEGLDKFAQRFELTVGQLIMKCRHNDGYPGPAETLFGDHEWNDPSESQEQDSNGNDNTTNEEASVVSANSNPNADSHEQSDDGGNAITETGENIDSDIQQDEDKEGSSGRAESPIPIAYKTTGGASHRKYQKHVRELMLSTPNNDPDV